MTPARPARRAQPWRPRLYLPAYSVADSARFAQTSPQTVAHWHFGASRLGPVIPGKERGTPGRERGTPLSYLQLVEIAFVATFRRLGISLQRIRRTREYASTVLSAEYPFAELRWKTEGMHLLLDLHDFDRPEAPDDGELIVADAAGQTAWGHMVSERFLEFEYVDGLAVIWHVRGTFSQVLIDPRVSFGAPMVNGIPTWAVKGRYEAGEEIEEIAADFSLDGEQVKQSLEFEGIDLGLSAA
ncbi:MAG TPA: DUF433 domain-containing protein [Dehalococcoidia bacterium]|nr:DUF433 domain-containing protein [Dehalococcoidia bacterium]